jgi:hypothetical protein
MGFGLCDTSAIDWGAVGAVGTWVVGISAGWLAFNANRIALGLRTAERGREERAARAMVWGLRHEARNYGLHLQSLAEKLKNLAQMPGASPATHAATVFETIEAVALSDFSNLATILPNLPDELGRKVSSLYAEEKTSSALFRNNAKYFRELERLGRDHQQQMSPLLDRGSAEISRLARRVFECVEAMTNYLEPASVKDSQPENG